MFPKGQINFGRNGDCVLHNLHGVREALWQWEADWQQANLPQIATVTAEQAATLQETLPTCTVEKVELEASPASSRPLSIATDANEMDTSEVQTSPTSLQTCPLTSLETALVPVWTPHYNTASALLRPFRTTCGSLVNLTYQIPQRKQMRQSLRTGPALVSH